MSSAAPSPLPLPPPSAPATAVRSYIISLLCTKLNISQADALAAAAPWKYSQAQYLRSATRGNLESVFGLDLANFLYDEITWTRFEEWKVRPEVVRGKQAAAILLAGFVGSVINWWWKRNSPTLVSSNQKAREMKVTTSSEVQLLIAALLPLPLPLLCWLEFSQPGVSRIWIWFFTFLFLLTVVFLVLFSWLGRLESRHARTRKELK